MWHECPKAQYPRPILNFLAGTSLCLVSEGPSLTTARWGAESLEGCWRLHTPALPYQLFLSHPLPSTGRADRNGVQDQCSDTAHPLPCRLHKTLLKAQAERPSGHRSSYSCTCSHFTWDTAWSLNRPTNHLSDEGMGLWGGVPSTQAS